MKPLLLLSSLLLVPHSLAQSWELVWEDNFDYNGLPDPTRWSYDEGGHGWGNQELQFYTSDRLENARVEGGVLTIEARKEAWAGRDYTSARLVSKNKGDWTYGRIAVRAQLPRGRGTWPALWMLPTSSSYGNGGWPDTGEIDIMEHVGHHQNDVHATVHTDLFNHLLGTQRGGSITIADASEAFHEYAVEWSPMLLKFSVDGTVFFQYPRGAQGWQGWPFDQPFHLIMNLAIGGSWGGQQGVDDTIFPQQMMIDHVRVYRYLDVPAVTLDAPASLEPGAMLTVRASASDSDGEIQRLRLYQADGLLDTFNQETAEWTLDAVHAGCYSLRAEAVDDDGWATVTDAAPLQVGDDCSSPAPYLMTPHQIPGVIQAEYFDLGGQDVSYQDLTPANDGGAIRADEGVDVYHTTDGTGYHIGGTAAREWVGYTVDVEEAGTYALEIRLATAGNRATFSLEFGGEDKTGIVEYTNTAGSGVWSTVRVRGIELSAGVQVMKIHFRTGVPNVNWILFRRLSGTSSASIPESGPTALYGNYPNPFVTATQIRYTVGMASHIVLELFNALGQRVRTLADRYHSPGEYALTVDSTGLPRGLYFYRLSGPTVQTRTLHFVGR